MSMLPPSVGEKPATSTSRTRRPSCWRNTNPEFVARSAVWSAVKFSNRHPRPSLTFNSKSE
jgi:hypothetical protein